MGKWKKWKELKKKEKEKERELEMRVTEIRRSIDWCAMDDYIKSRDAWCIYNGIRARARRRLNSFTSLAYVIEEPNPLISTYKEMYPHLTCAKPRLDKLMLQKIQAYEGMLKKKPFHLFGLGFGMGSLFIGGTMYAAKFF